VQPDGLCDLGCPQQPHRGEHNHQRSQTHGFSPDKTNKNVLGSKKKGFILYDRLDTERSPCSA
jgi:hypothetical protein